MKSFGGWDSDSAGDRTTPNAHCLCTLPVHTTMDGLNWTENNYITRPFSPVVFTIQNRVLRKKTFLHFGRVLSCKFHACGPVSICAKAEINGTLSLAATSKAVVDYSRYASMQIWMRRYDAHLHGRFYPTSSCRILYVGKWQKVGWNVVVFQFLVLISRPISCPFLAQIENLQSRAM